MNAHYIIRPVIFQGFDVYYLKNDKCNTYSREDEKTFCTLYDLRHIIYANVYLLHVYIKIVENVNGICKRTK